MLRKYIKWTLIVLGGLIVLAFLGFQIAMYNTKKHSPENEVKMTMKGVDFYVFYNSPFKKNRVIFGGLVPFGKVWRTGANEPTRFKVSQDVFIGGRVLPAGEYSLWAIPNEKSWQVIFNSDIPSWGLSFDGSSSRVPNKDVVSVEVEVQQLEEVVESFTITFDVEGGLFNLDFIWDKTKVSVPIVFP